jgi:hypothetical protein
VKIETGVGVASVGRGGRGPGGGGLRDRRRDREGLRALDRTSSAYWNTFFSTEGLRPRSGGVGGRVDLPSREDEGAFLQEFLRPPSEASHSISILIKTLTASRSMPSEGACRNGRMVDVLVRSSSTCGVGDAGLGDPEIDSTALSFPNSVALGGDDNFSVDDEEL